MIKEHRVYLAWLVIGVLAAFTPILLGGIYAIGDMQNVHIPIEDFYQREMRAGNIPTWNPDVAWGFPVTATGQLGFFYPPLLFLRSLLPLTIYFSLTLTLHVIAAGIGTFLFFRALKYSDSGAYIGAITFSLSAYIWQHLSQLNILLALAWLPWQFLSVYIIASQPRIKFKHISVLALLFGLPFLIGQFQIPFLSAAVSSLYFIHLRGWRLKKIRKSINIVAIIAVLALALATVQILPTAELFQQSSRSNVDSSTDHLNQHSYPLYHLPTVFFPRFFSTDDTYWGKRLEVEYGLYLGAIPLILAIWSLYKMVRTKNVEQRTTFFVWLLVISFLLALGDFSPFRLLKLEPSLWIFTGPARWLLFTTFALSVFTSTAFDRIFRKKRLAKSFSSYTKWISMIILLGVIISNALLHAIDLNQFIPTDDPFVLHKIHSMLESARHSSVSLTSPFTAVTLIGILALPLILGRKYTKRVILTLTTVELIVFALTANPTVPWQNIRATPTIVSELPSAVINKQERIYTIRDGGDTGAYFTNPESRGGPAALELKRQQLIPMTNSLFNIAGIEWSASLLPVEQDEALANLRAENSYDITNDQLAQELNIGATLSIVNGKVHVEERTAKPRVEVVDSNQETITAHAVYKEISGSHTQIVLNTPQPGTLILRDTYFPGWQATVNGQQTPITFRKPFFRAVAIPAGNSTIEFMYISKRLHAGLVISLATLAILATAIVYTHRQTKHHHKYHKA